LSRFGGQIRAIAASDVAVAARGVSNFVQAVLVPELALRLIKEDMGLGVPSLQRAHARKPQEVGRRRRQQPLRRTQDAAAAAASKDDNADANAGAGTGTGADVEADASVDADKAARRIMRESAAIGELLHVDEEDDDYYG
jgi:hypothetical protein